MLLFVLALLIDDSILDGAAPVVIRANPAEFIHIFVKNPERLTEFLEKMTEVNPKCANLIYNTLLELYLQEYARQSDITVSFHDKE